MNEFCMLSLCDMFSYMDISKGLLTENYYWIISKQVL